MSLFPVLCISVPITLSRFMNVCKTTTTTRTTTTARRTFQDGLLWYSISDLRSLLNKELIKSHYWQNIFHCQIAKNSKMDRIQGKSQDYIHIYHGQVHNGRLFWIGRGINMIIFIMHLIKSRGSVIDYIR